MALKDKDEYNAYMKDYMQRRYHQRMQAARDRLGGKCCVCGETEELDFDHIDRSTKSFTIAKMWSVSEDKFNAEVAKCQLLCKACHEEKTRKDFGQVSAKITHGTLSSYRYCKCALCKQAKSDYGKARYASRASS